MPLHLRDSFGARGRSERFCAQMFRARFITTYVLYVEVGKGGIGIGIGIGVGVGVEVQQAGKYVL